MGMEAVQFLPQPPDQESTSAEDPITVLFRDFGGRVYGLALKIGLSREEAEDGVQEVFMKLQRRLDTFRGESALSTWLYRVALNTLHDYRRRMVRQERIFTAPFPSTGAGEPLATRSESSPLESAERRERSLKVRAAMDALPEKYRKALVLRELEHLSYREIADILEIPQGTVESRLFRARKKLAIELRRLEDQL
ncbi:MAG TPA: hypothetical protein DDW23_05175 [Planctomycetes bacterium]|nr:hypothetical protein [Planctomycetota bacterium]|tara:strand:+ start:1115 stop:1699 length:585 start_codon:yes stop_codon:yes gene_type:complete